MIHVELFRAHHIETLTPQPEQIAEYKAINPVSARAAEMRGEGYSVLLDDKTLACAVITDFGDGRGNIWALVGKDAGPYMKRIYRVAKKLMDESKLPRIETTVLTSFEAGHRWMKLLGFKLETPEGMRKFGPNGETYSLYARVL